MMTLKDLIKQKAILKARLNELVKTEPMSQDNWTKAKELNQKIRFYQASIDLELNDKKQRGFCDLK